MSEIIHVTDSTFDHQVYESEVPVLVDFWATWCGPCSAIEPILELLADEFEDELKVVKVNIDDNPVLAAKMRIRNIPALSLFRDAQLVAVKNGAVGLNDLRSFINANL